MLQSALFGTLEVSLPSLHDRAPGRIHSTHPRFSCCRHSRMTVAAKNLPCFLKVSAVHESNSRSLDLLPSQRPELCTILVDCNISLKLSRSLLHWSATFSISASSQGFPTQSRETLSLSIRDMKRERSGEDRRAQRGERLRSGSEEGMREQDVQEADRSRVRQELHMVPIEDINTENLNQQLVSLSSRRGYI